MILTQDDLRAVRALRNGRQQGLEHLMRRISPVLRRAGRYFMGYTLYDQLGEEWIQDTWMRVWRRRKTIDPTKNFVAWVRLNAVTAAHNLKIKAKSKKRNSEQGFIPIDGCVHNDGQQFVLELPAEMKDPIEMVLTQKKLERLLNDLGPDQFWLLWDYHITCEGSFHALLKLHHRSYKTLKPELENVISRAHVMIGSDMRSLPPVQYGAGSSSAHA